MTEKKEPTVRLIFTWESFNPDHRQWKPSNPLVIADCKVAIDIPLTTDLIINAASIASQQITNQKEDEPILTPLGMRYCIDQFETAMSDAKPEEEGETAKEDTSGWDDGEEEFVPTGKEKPKATKKAEDWDELENDNGSTKEQEKWDEDWES